MSATNPYAQLLGQRDVLEVLEETPGRLESFAKELGPQRMNESYAPGKWTLNQVLCHLADCELAFAYRWRQVVAQPHHTIQPFKQEDWAKRYSMLDGNAALAAFLANRRWSVAWLKALPKADWDKLATHPERGEMTLRNLLELTAGHDLNHRAQFEKVAAAAKASSKP